MLQDGSRVLDCDYVLRLGEVVSQLPRLSVGLPAGYDGVSHLHQGYTKFLLYVQVVR